ncbi:hypothetical protein B5X24_HaOG205897, partial [Helicoverpa armigera]
MEGLLQRQHIIAEAIQKLSTNIKKDSAIRKTAEYIRKRLVNLEELWDEFENNHKKLTVFCDNKHEYFQSGVYLSVKELYAATCALLMDITSTETVAKQGTSSQGEGDELHNVSTEEKGTLSKTDELISQQRTNFRAFSRVVRGIDINIISEKWELQDKLQMVQARWKTIDDLHWQIDNLLIGTEVDYEQEYVEHENIYETTKRQLNQKLSHTSHQQQTMPKVEIPAFNGNYAQWPTFMDLYSEAIHNNPFLSKTQKLQYLKGKLKGEAERLVQHLNVSAENYDACWDILTRRYNNIQLLFTKQIQIFLSQPVVHHHSAQELKNLHDTTLETIHAIRNLGVDTTTWDPLLVHILTEKMDTETYSAYMECRKAPRNLPSFVEAMEFLESKFTALEPVNRKNNKAGFPKHEAKNRNNIEAKEFSSKQLPMKFNNKTRTYHVRSERKCPLCKSDHILVACKTFQGMAPEDKINTITQLKVCENCMYCHNDKQCNSAKTCRVCNNKHHTTLHDAMQQKVPTNNLTPKGVPTVAQHKSHHVAGNANEVLLATIELCVLGENGMPIKLRALLDQGSQINLITESAAQRLGLHRRKQDAIVSGVGISNNKSHGTVLLTCESIYQDYNFTVEALVMANLLNNLPNYTFERQQWPHLENISLADPNYNISRPVDILLDAGVYAQIIMDGILRGPIHAPIAQQTKLGWVLLGNTTTYQCHAVLNNLEDISRFWEIEEITEQSTTLTSDEQYCETLYKTTTTRRSDGRYEVRIPMKPAFERQLGSSKSQALAQFRQLEKRLSRDQSLSESYKTFMADYIRLNHMKQSLTSVQPSCYLPHHGVMKLDSTTTKLRVVFNASNKTTSGYSLNELMERGPNLQQDLQALILRWRRFPFVYTADIEKFYREVRIQEQDQHLQRILWRDSEEDKIKEYQLCTVTYGTKAAPFLAMRTIKQLIYDDGAQYPLAAEILQSQLYVDDLLAGNYDIQQAKATQQQLINLLKQGGFNLRKWASNDKRLLEDLKPDQISQNMIDFKHAETNKTLG